MQMMVPVCFGLDNAGRNADKHERDAGHKCGDSGNGPGWRLADSLVEVVVVVSPASQPHPKSEIVSRRQGPGARQQAEQHRNWLRKQGTRLESPSMFVH